MGAELGDSGACSSMPFGFIRLSRISRRRTRCATSGYLYRHDYEYHESGLDVLQSNKMLQRANLPRRDQHVAVP